MVSRSLGCAIVLLSASWAHAQTEQPASARPIPINPATCAVADRLVELRKPEAPPPPAEEPPPLPFHTIEGYGGGGITPMAYLVNPGPKGCVFGLPAFAATAAWMGKKNLQAYSVSETLWERLELSYAYDRFGVGDLDDDIKDATGIDIDHNTVIMHNFNARLGLIQENAWGTKLPAITAGIHYKTNEDIDSIDHTLGGALSNIGYRKSSGTDFTLVATKAFKSCWTLNRPLMLSGGLRSSEAAQLGFLGFGSERRTTFEGNIVYMPRDNIVLGYEYRQKKNPYDQIPGLLGPEDDWHSIDACWVVNKHLTLTGGWGIFGNLCNTRENGGVFFQAKFEF